MQPRLRDGADRRGRARVVGRGSVTGPPAVLAVPVRRVDRLGAVQTELTGDPRVDAALERLGSLAGLPLPAHVTVYDDVHRLLQDALADLDGPAGS